MSGDTEYAQIKVGDVLPAWEFALTRTNLIRYCGACTDFTGVHWNERIAKSVGLPDVIAHGTLTAAAALRLVTDWTGDPESVLDYQARFKIPVPVPDDAAGVTLTVGCVVKEKLDGDRVVLSLTITAEDGRTVSTVRATVRLPSVRNV